MQSEVKQRLIAYIAHKGIGQKSFALTAGLSPAFVGSIRVSIQPKTIDKIAAAFPDLNTTWLLTGEGEMLRTKAQGDGVGTQASAGAIALDHPSQTAGAHSTNMMACTASPATEQALADIRQAIDTLNSQTPVTEQALRDILSAVERIDRRIDTELAKAQEALATAQRQVTDLIALLAQKG